ncbi:unnamed protein product [Calypogeia fissa]
MVQEVVTSTPPNEFQNSVRAQPESWTAELISKVFGMNLDGEGYILRGENFTAPYFDGNINPKEGWVLRKCNHIPLRRVLAFLVPLIYPERPNRVTVKIGSTIIASYLRMRKISWPKILEDVISKQVKILESKTPSSLSCYLAHIYFHQKVMFREEKLDYKVKVTLIEYDEKDPDDAQDTCDESDSEVDIVAPLKRRKDYHPASYLASIPVNIPVPNNNSSLGLKEDFAEIQKLLTRLQEKSILNQDKLEKVSTIVGVEVDRLVEGVEEAIQTSTTTQIEQLEKNREADQKKINSLQSSINWMQERMSEKKEMHKKVNSCLEQLESLYEFTKIDMLKAHLFDEYFRKNPNPLLFTKIIGVTVDMATKCEEALSFMKDLSIEIKKLLNKQELNVPKLEYPS